MKDNLVPRSHGSEMPEPETAARDHSREPETAAKTTGPQPRHERPDSDMQQEFPRWFESKIGNLYTANDPRCTPDLFALACGPLSTATSINSCVVNGVKFVVHSRDVKRTTQNSGICSPGEKPGEMYYGQLEDILEFSYTQFKVVLFRVKWFDLAKRAKTQNSS
ncbi:hypothetical protein CTI12_AA058990 [Artemisia annua]|uniref:DUF4216 domain-containing protein n=1 Tax=Artemisia annua TaxID=35608 RepID=A0A2U1Q952_ARTAN|nr:hypothetical protein CTI12_AA058990 [Artemisia annua]